MTVYEIPINPVDQLFNVTLGEFLYHLRIMWNDQPEGGWIIDINDKDDNPLVHGIPLVAGADLLGQYAYLGIGGGGFLYVYTDGQPYLQPTKENLGKNSHLLWQPYES